MNRPLRKRDAGVGMMFMLLSACGGADPGSAEPEPLLRLPGDLCTVDGAVAGLAPVIDESSGIVKSRRHPGVYWTHNDSGGTPELFAVDRRGRLLGRVLIPGVQNRDWEDLAYGPCAVPGADVSGGLPERHGCLWIGEFGDNQQVHDTVYLYRVPEPNPTDSRTAPPDVFPFVYAEGPRDAEALFFDAQDRPWIVSKGRPLQDPPGADPQRGDGRVTAYRLPVLDVPGVLSVAQPVQHLSDGPPSRGQRVTGGASSPLARRVVLRTYDDLRFFRFDGDTLRPVASNARVDLRPLQEPQGEGVDLGEDGTVVLSSEQGAGGPGTLWVLQCDIP